MGKEIKVSAQDYMQLARGTANIVRMRKEIRDVIMALHGAIKAQIGDGNFPPDWHLDHWAITFANDEGYPMMYFRRDLIVAKNYYEPYLHTVQSIYQSLPRLLWGLRESFPVIEQGLKPYFEAANFEF
jgi:hypothetical protein